MQLYFSLWHESISCGLTWWHLIWSLTRQQIPYSFSDTLHFAWPIYHRKTIPMPVVWYMRKWPIQSIYGRCANLSEVVLLLPTFPRTGHPMWMWHNSFTKFSSPIAYSSAKIENRGNYSSQWKFLRVNPIRTIYWRSFAIAKLLPCRHFANNENFTGWVEISQYYEAGLLFFGSRWQIWNLGDGERFGMTKGTRPNGIHFGQL